MGAACSSVPNTKSVIVVGGGWVGSSLAKQLDPTFDVTLIEPQDALHHKIAALRGAVVPGWEKRVRIPLGNLLRRGKIVRANVKSVTSGQVTLNDGTVLAADYIVLCHGGPGRFPSPCDPKVGVVDSESVLQDLKASQALVSQAETILIVGGGPVGVELAGEISAQYPTKKITLVHSKAALLSNSTPPIKPQVSTNLVNLLRQVGVDVKLGVRVTSGLEGQQSGFIPGKKQYSLSDGTQIWADLAFDATGHRIGHVDQNIVGNAFVNEQNLVKVDNHLQVVGLDGVFCCGDANNFAETKMAYTGGEQAKYVAQTLIHGGTNSKPYVGLSGAPFGAMFVPVGPNLGVGGMGNSVMGSFLVSRIKGRGLFTKRAFKDANAVLPTI